MVFTVILGLVLAALASTWGVDGPSTTPSALATLAFTASPAVLAGLVALRFRILARRALGDPENHYAAMAALYGRLRRLSRALEFAVLASYSASLAAGWRAMPDALGVSRWNLFSRAVVFAPFLVSLFATWAVIHFAESALREGGPTFAQRLSFKLRYNVLTICVPVAVLLAVFDLSLIHI